MMGKFFTSVALIFVLLLLGCQTIKYKNELSGRFKSRRDPEGTKPALRVRDYNFPETQIQFNSAAITDDSLRFKIAIEATNSQRTSTQTLEVWAQIRNRTDFPLQIECRVHWFDKRKASVTNPSAWQRIYLSPNSIETYKESSSDIYDINYYYIEIREGK